MEEHDEITSHRRQCLPHLRTYWLAIVVCYDGRPLVASQAFCAEDWRQPSTRARMRFITGIHAHWWRFLLTVILKGTQGSHAKHSVRVSFIENQLGYPAGNLRSLWWHSKLIGKWAAVPIRLCHGVGLSPAIWCWPKRASPFLGCLSVYVAVNVNSGNNGEERTAVDDIIAPGFSRAAYTRLLACVRSYRIDERFCCWLGTDSVKGRIKYKSSPFIIIVTVSSDA
jgi:hypothetical protein